MERSTDLPQEVCTDQQEWTPKGSKILASLDLTSKIQLRCRGLMPNR